MKIKEGDYAIVFDSMNWKIDIGDNSHLWKKAKILKKYWYSSFVGAWLVDVEFEDGHVSKGHFLRGIKPI